MTRQGGTHGFKPRRSGGTGPTPERVDRVREVLRAKATRYIERQPDAPLLLDILGLVEAPAAELARRARAVAAMAHKQAPAVVGEVQPGHCPCCGNSIPKSGVCRKRTVCREAAARKELKT